jgi:hypothetical protein
MSKYRIVKMGFSYFVEIYSMVNYDGIYDYGWKEIARFDTEEEAQDYIRVMSK